MTIDEEIQRGEEASRLMNEPLMKAAFSSVESGLIEAMKFVPLGDKETQHELVLSLQILGRVRRYMTETMQTGKLARIQKETLAQKAKKLFRAA